MGQALQAELGRLQAELAQRVESMGEDQKGAALHGSWARPHAPGARARNLPPSWLCSRRSVDDHQWMPA